MIATVDDSNKNLVRVLERGENRNLKRSRLEAFKSSFRKTNNLIAELVSLALKIKPCSQIDLL